MGVGRVVTRWGNQASQRGIGVMRDEAMRACEAVQDASEGFVSLRFGNEPVTLGGEA